MNVYMIATLVVLGYWHSVDGTKLQDKLKDLNGCDPEDPKGCCEFMSLGKSKCCVKVVKFVVKEIEKFQEKKDNYKKEVPDFMYQARSAVEAMMKKCNAKPNDGEWKKAGNLTDIFRSETADSYVLKFNNSMIFFTLAICISLVLARELPGSH